MIGNIRIKIIRHLECSNN